MIDMLFCYCYGFYCVSMCNRDKALRDCGCDFQVSDLFEPSMQIHMNNVHTYVHVDEVIYCMYVRRWSTDLNVKLLCTYMYVFL